MLTLKISVFVMDSYNHIKLQFVIFLIKYYLARISSPEYFRTPSCFNITCEILYYSSQKNYVSFPSLLVSHWYKITCFLLVSTMLLCNEKLC